MKITNIESIPYAIPVKNFTDAYTDFTHSNAVLIKMHTDEGVTGIGEACDCAGDELRDCSNETCHPAWMFVYFSTIYI